jgi:hypothetical protein
LKRKKKKRRRKWREKTGERLLGIRRLRAVSFKEEERLEKR